MKSTSKKVEALAIVFIVLALFTRVSSLGMDRLIAGLFGASREAQELRLQGRVMLTLWNFVRVMVDIGIGVWLFISASKAGRSKWIWGLFGLTGGLTAAVLFVLVDIADTLKGRKEG